MPAAVAGRGLLALLRQDGFQIAIVLGFPAAIGAAAARLLV